MPLLARRRVLGAAFQCLQAGSFLLQFTYGPVSPIPAKMMRTLSVRGSPIARIWRNVPPATVWRYERAAAGPLDSLAESLTFAAQGRI